MDSLHSLYGGDAHGLSLKNMSISELVSLQIRLNNETAQASTVEPSTRMDDVDDGGEEWRSGPPNVLLSYLMHSLPYCQSAFNWLFYAFLNRNLRLASGKCATGGAAKSGVTNDPISFNEAAYSFQNHSSSMAAHQNDDGSGGDFRRANALWRSIQRLGRYVRSASDIVDSHLVNRSPFKWKSEPGNRSRTRLRHCCNLGSESSRRFLFSTSYISSSEKAITSNGSHHNFTSATNNYGKGPSSNGLLSPQSALSSQYTYLMISRSNETLRTSQATSGSEKLQDVEDVLVNFPNCQLLSFEKEESSSGQSMVRSAENSPPHDKVSFRDLPDGDGGEMEWL